MWIERQKLDRELPFPLGEYPLYGNDAGLLAICTGGGITNASTSIMALGMDPRFDLQQGLLARRRHRGRRPGGRCRSAPPRGPGHVVDGDLLYEIDAREMPKDWPYGLLPLGAKKPNDERMAGPSTPSNIRSTLKLADWAYALTKDHSYRGQLRRWPRSENSSRDFRTR